MMTCQNCPKLVILLPIKLLLKMAEPACLPALAWSGLAW
jgi:hypothetical protein